MESIERLKFLLFRISAIASVGLIRLAYITVNVSSMVGLHPRGLSRTVCGDDRSTSGEALYTMHQHNASVVQSIVDELARRGQVYEQVCVVNILHRYT